MVSNKDIRKVRGCSNSEIRKLVLGAMRAGFRYRMTRGGVILFGENGESASVHFSQSDHRSVKNTESHLRKMGFQLPAK